MRPPVALATATVLLASLTVSSSAEQTAFRITDLDWRDPHFFATIAVLGCADVTNFNAFGILGVNPATQNTIENDVDGDGNLDLSYLIVFDALVPVRGSAALQWDDNTLLFGGGNCTAPAVGTTCTPLTMNGHVFSEPAGTCLGILAGTTNAGYTPAITTPGAPCFVAPVGTLTLDVAGMPLTLTDAYLAATYVGDPATGLVNGLIRGFMSEAVANATIMPDDMAFGAGDPISSLWRGGNNSCSQTAPATGDKDIGPGGVAGWYVYLNFTATVVDYDGPTSIRDTPAHSLTLELPMPNPFNPSTVIHYTLPHTGPVALDIYDAHGGHVTRLSSGTQIAGRHQATWNGTDHHGNVAASGVYFLRLSAQSETRVQKLVLLK